MPTPTRFPYWRPASPGAAPPAAERKADCSGDFGPRLITGASDDDPSGIATYSLTGAQFGYAMCG